MAAFTLVLPSSAAVLISADLRLNRQRTLSLPSSWLLCTQINTRTTQRFNNEHGSPRKNTFIEDNWSDENVSFTVALHVYQITNKKKDFTGKLKTACATLPTLLHIVVWWLGLKSKRLKSIWMQLPHPSPVWPSCMCPHVYLVPQQPHNKGILALQS